MAEVAAGLYAVETVVEGAALGAFAVSRPTAPLHLTFRRIGLQTDGQKLSRSGHTLSIVRGKAYVIGGRGAANDSDNEAGNGPVLSLTLPVASSTDGEGDLTPRDYEVVKPEFRDNDRPLAPPKEADHTDDLRLFDREGHTTTVIGDKLYIWGGQATSSSLTDKDLFNQFVVFDPLTNTYDLLKVKAMTGEHGSPLGRVNHSATSSQAERSDSLLRGPQVTGRDTIFVHGGYSNAADNCALRDSWAFDIEQCVWSRLPDLPEPGPSEVANEGSLTYVKGRLWRLGDGFGRVVYLELDTNKPSLTADSIQWQVVSFGTEATGTGNTVAGPEPASSTKDTSSLPMPRRNASVLPVSTGSGRTYLLYFMGEELKTGVSNDFWSFQIPSEENTAASLKDTIRDAVAGKAKKSWNSGKYSWAKCEIKMETGSKAAGDHNEEKSTAAWPEGKDLRAYASDVWADQGRNVFVVWGGKHGEAAVDGGWVVTVTS